MGAMLVRIQVNHRHRRLRQHRFAGIDDLKLPRIQLVHAQQRLVFPGNQDIALPTLNKRDR